ncbi:MAG: aminotransferase class IV [Planctomycetes bacterium]|nr:aminotransferase class IV [Planctomycetota bacterium]MBU1517432.1 aminotransferase class IV [Planctomycetota bacterium]MBU2457653.1 aminotransferase class IV [Planctomycetota bacterium]MBU2596084.1 aminotransferase class IV [Planctomycetota bacterium]
MNKVFLNNEIVESSAASISGADGGFLYGAGLFETMRASNGVVFALDDHLDRLFTSAEKLKINLRGDLPSQSYGKAGKKFVADAVYETLNANSLKEARIRLTATSGTINAEQPEPTLLVTAVSFEPYPKEYYDKGITVVLNSYRQNPADVLAGHKTTSYFSRIFALGLAHQKLAAEALWFTIDGRLAEGCVSNVFIVKDSTLLTPSLKTGILPGIARKTVLNLAAENSMKHEEKDLGIDDLLGAGEVFITNVIMQVMPVIKIEAHDIGSAKPGQITKKIAALYTEHFNKEVS